jgi:signal transduction histidine kinase
MPATELRFGMRLAVLVALGPLTAIVAAAVAGRPAWLFVDNSTLLVGLETIAGVGALAAGGAALARFERTRAGNDLALAAAIVVLLTSMLLTALTVDPVGASASLAWLPVPTRLAAAALFVVAGRPRTPTPRRLPGRLWLVVLGVVLVAALVLVGAGLGELFGGAVPHWVQFVTVALYLIGAVALFQRAQRVGGSALRWFAAGAVGVAATRLAFTLLPAPAESWVSPGDVMRVITSLLLLMAVRAEVLAHAHRAVESVIEQERRRLARDIHDGMAQELAFIVSQSRRLVGREPDPTTLELLAEAGQTALADTRRMIYDLKRPGTRALGAMIAERSLQVTKRAGLALDMEVNGEVAVGAEVEYAVLRIIGEAVSNAAKHGEARTVSIRVSSEENQVLVRISDDGRGFDMRRHPRRRSFGLASMSQRAESLGGRLRLESEPGRGTMIEVTI